MRTFLKYAIIIALVPAMLFTSCKKENEETFNAQEVLADYLVEQNLDINTIIGGFVLAPADESEVSNFYIIDIRSASDYETGRIAGSHRVDFANLLTEAALADKPILVVCKTGQTATYAVALLRLSGYADAKALKWGMSAWNSNFDVWTSSISNIAEGHNNWTTSAAPTNLTYSSPEFTSNSTDPAEILRQRVAAVFAEGFKTATADDVLNTPANYFINNYFSEADYLGYGHINGAYRINPLLVGEGQVNFLDPSKKIATYCYTGQTSAAITAYLRVLGYDAVSVTFGMNRLYNSNTAWATSPNRWNATMARSFPYVTGK